jgi:cbb3-type cytochrome c oxidase subunit III
MDGTTKPDGATLRRLALAALLALATAAAGCGGSGSGAGAKTSTGPSAAQRAAQARQMAAGAQVFAKKCALCHTLAGKVAHPSYEESPIPNLDEVKPKASYVRARATSGGFDMPSLQSELTAAQMTAVVAYVASASGRNVAVGSSSVDTASGEQLFRSHCQSCHAIAGRPATGHPAYPGTSFSEVRPSVRMIVNQVRRGIKEEMPSFRRKLTAAQIEAVAHYVNAVAGR